MRSSRRRDDLTRFLWRLPLAALLAAVVWLAVRPAYNPAVCALAQVVARLYEYPKAALITTEGDRVTLGRTDLRADSGRMQLSLTQLTFNLIPFLALVLALPRPLSRGGPRALALGVAILAASHAVGLVLHLKFFYAFSLGPWSRANYSDLARNVIGGLQYFYDIPVTFALPLLLWVGLLPARVFGLLGLGTEAGQPPHA